jgi:Acyl-CoA dehydrogenase, C-terminal domain
LPARQDEIPRRRGYDRGCIHRANPLNEDGNRLIHPPHMSGVQRCSPEFVERRECRPVAIWRGIAVTGVGQDALPKRHRDEPLGTVTANQRRGPEPLASLLPMTAVQGRALVGGSGTGQNDRRLAHAKLRHTFGKPLIQHQVIRHKLVDMRQRIAASQAFLELVAWQMDQNLNPVADISLLKNQATQTLAFCASEAVQIFGGSGFMRGVKVERIYREVKVYAIGGGAEEIMKELASRQLGF